MQVTSKKEYAVRYVLSNTALGISRFGVGRLADVARIIGLDVQKLYHRLKTSTGLESEGWTIERQQIKDVHAELKKLGVPVKPWQKGFDVLIPGESRYRDEEDKAFLKLFDSLPKASDKKKK